MAVTNYLWQFVNKPNHNRTTKGAEIPLLAGAPPKLEMMGPTAPGIEEAFGITNNYYLDNGAIKYGPIESGNKDFLTVFNKWYNEGLIDPDFATNDQKTFDAKVTSGKAGAFFGYIGGSMGRYLPALQETDPQAKLSAVQFPVLNKGDQPLFTGHSWEWDLNGAVITKSAKNPEEIVKAFDYLYSPEGHMLKNFGIEGQTYTMRTDSRYTPIRSILGIARPEGSEGNEQNQLRCDNVPG